MPENNNSGKTALIVVDAQNGVLEKVFNRNRIIQNIKNVVEKAKKADVPVIYVQHTDEKDLPENSSPWEIVPDLEVSEKDYRVSKKFNSSFEETDLDSILKTLDVSKIVLAGAATNWCVRATAFGALAGGYDLTLVGDAHTTEDMELSETKTLFAEDLILELNIGIKYVEYPRSRTEVVNSGEIVF